MKHKLFDLGYHIQINNIFNHPVLHTQITNLINTIVNLN